MTFVYKLYFKIVFLVSIPSQGNPYYVVNIHVIEMRGEGRGLVDRKEEIRGWGLMDRKGEIRMWGLVDSKEEIRG